MDEDQDTEEQQLTDVWVVFSDTPTPTPLSLPRDGGESETNR